MPERRKHFWMMQHERFHIQAAKGGFDVMFLGDSITSAWMTKGRGLEIWDHDIAPLNAANFGSSGECTQNVLWRLEHGELDGALDPKVLVFLLGTNNAENDKPEEVAAGVGAILKKFHARFPKCKILLLAIFPRGATPSDAKRINNETTNKLLAKFDGFWNIRYLDINKKFLEPDGTLSARIMGDRLHPAAVGYQIWADAIVPEIKVALAK
jgi:lysophospholipase L1-like esterase